MPSSSQVWNNVLMRQGLHVLMQVVDGAGAPGMKAEIACYDRWLTGNAVRGVVLVDLVPDDPRPEILHRLGLPAVIVGEPGPDAPLPSVRTDSYAAIHEAVSRLAALGHRRIARVTGMTELVHTRERTRAFYDAASALGCLLFRPRATTRPRAAPPPRSSCSTSPVRRRRSCTTTM